MSEQTHSWPTYEKIRELTAELTALRKERDALREAVWRGYGLTKNSFDSKAREASDMLLAAYAE